jgi:hypothetical protein
MKPAYLNKRRLTTNLKKQARYPLQYIRRNIDNNNSHYTLKPLISSFSRMITIFNNILKDNENARSG